MKLLFFLLSLAIALSCTGNKVMSDNLQDKRAENEILVSKFQKILDTANVEGSILVYDLTKDKYYSNNFSWTRKEKLPASTFKITNSIIALETEVVEDENTLFKWDGERRRLKIWEQDLNLKQAFHFSCVPCYQEIARKIGVKRMNKYLNKLQYGNIKADSENIDLFWLEGDSKISQSQQIEFLKRFYQSKLPISQKTESIMKRLMVIEKKENYNLSGKTGWSIRNGNNNGWFVGYIETKNKTYFFATNVEPKEKFDMKMFPMIRKNVTFKALKHIGLTQFEIR